MPRRMVATIPAVSAPSAAAVAVWLASGSLVSPAESIIPNPDFQPLVAAGYASQSETDSYTFNRPLIEQQLDQLPPADDIVIRAYERDAFGQRWADIDRNGCDTRNDLLRIWLTDVTFKPGTHDCVVLTGTLTDPFGGTTISFTRGQGTSEAVQIDHLWPLSAAWQRGADAWTEEKRLQFANDPLNLTPVDGILNQSKSDSGPEWMPPNVSYRCAYAARMILVATNYQLELTPDDRVALETTLASCA